MARVLLVSLVFAPDGVSTAQLMSELAIDLNRAGHAVEVVTTQPHYNRDPVAEAAQPLHCRWRGVLYQSVFHGIPVFHAAMGRKRGGFGTRLVGWARFHAVTLIAGLFLVEQPDIILVPSPLLTAGVLGWVLARLRGAAFVYNVQELYPDLAITLGHLRNPWLIRLLLWLEQFVYRKAAAITVISGGIRRALVNKGVPERRVHLIPNFVDVEWLRPGPRDNPFRLEYGLGSKFVVSYAGNMGFAQGLEALLEAAELLMGESDILFLFVGDGVSRRQLEDHARARDLTNTVFVSHQPYSRVPEIYAASDASVVALIGAMSSEALPSKVLRIMACGRPVLAITDPGSDLADEVRRSGAGIVAPSESARGIADAVLELRNSPERCRSAGNAGRAHVCQYYSRSVVTARYGSLFAELSASDGAHGAS